MLQEVELPVVSNNECHRDMSSQGLTITDAMLCTYTQEGKNIKGLCSGDSGGPLSVERDGRHILIGDTSHAAFFCLISEHKYNVFGNVAYFRNWIESVLRNLGGGAFCDDEPKPAGPWHQMTP